MKKFFKSFLDAIKKAFKAVVAWCKSHIVASAAIAAGLVAVIVVAIVVPIAVSNGKKKNTSGEQDSGVVVPTLSKEYVKGVVDDYNDKQNYAISFTSKNSDAANNIEIDGSTYKLSDTMLIDYASNGENIFVYNKVYGDWLKQTATEAFPGLAILLLGYLLQPTSVISNAAEFFENEGSETIGIHSYVYATDTEQWYYTFDDKNQDIAEIKYSKRTDITEAFTLETTSKLSKRGKIHAVIPTELIDFNDNVITLYELKHFTATTLEGLKTKAEFTIEQESYFDESHQVWNPTEVNCSREDENTLILTSGSDVRKIETDNFGDNTYYAFEGGSFNEMDDEDVENDKCIPRYLYFMEKLEKFVDTSTPMEEGASFTNSGVFSTYEVSGKHKFEAKLDKTDPGEKGGKFFSKFNYIEHGTNAGAPFSAEFRLSVSKLPTDY